MAAGLRPSAEGTASLQEAYEPRGRCFVCGHAHEGGLRMQSFRSPDGLRSEVTVPDAWCEVPGVLSPGALMSIITCHSNWQASIALLDRAVLPRPPLLALTAFSSHFATTATQPNAPLRLTSRVTRLRDRTEPFSVDVAVELRAAPQDGSIGEALITAEASFTKIGAVRSL